MFLGNVCRVRPFPFELGVRFVLAMLREDYSRGFLNGINGGIFYRTRSVSVIDVDLMRFGRDRFEVIPYECAFVARCPTGFVRFFGTTRGRTLRIGLGHSARVGFRVRHVVVDSG